MPTLTRTDALLNRSRVLSTITSPMTLSDLEPLIPLHSDVIRQWLKKLVRDGDIHIKGWTSPGRPSPIFSPGPGHNVKRPPILTASEKRRKHYESLRNDPEKYEAYLKRLKTSRMKPTMQPELAFFFGYGVHK